MENAQQWFRSEVLSLPSYVPGGVIEDPAVIKLASNELPFSPLKQVQASVLSTLGDYNSYPDMFGRDLIATLAQHYQWDGGIVLGNGSTALIEKILQAVTTPNGEIVYAWRSFEAYPIAVQAAGGISVQVPLTSKGEHDLTAMARAATDNTRAILVCSPNNPTGTVISHDEFVEFMNSVPARIPVLLDEAYIDFADESFDPIRSIELLNTYKNLVVLRTFSKAYGLAGLRCGFSLCSQDFAGPLSSIMTPFGVNSVAQIAARSALHAHEYVEKQVQFVCDERERVVKKARELGYAIPSTGSNFFWLTFANETDINAFMSLCEEKKIVVRRFANEGVRLSIGNVEGNNRIIDVLTMHSTNTTHE